LAVNFTARRNYLPAHSAHSRGRKPTYGVLVRPLQRPHPMQSMPGWNKGRPSTSRFGAT
jgi:hypothetical protein